MAQRNNDARMLVEKSVQVFMIFHILSIHYLDFDRNYFGRFWQLDNRELVERQIGWGTSRRRKEKLPVRLIRGANLAAWNRRDERKPTGPYNGSGPGGFSGRATGRKRERENRCVTSGGQYFRAARIRLHYFSLKQIVGQTAPPRASTSCNLHIHFSQR